MTNSHPLRDRSVMMSSVSPSTSISVCSPPLRFVNGSTTRDGLAGRSSELIVGWGVIASVAAASVASLTSATNR